FPKLAGAFLLPIVLGRLYEAALKTRWARRRLEQGGHLELLTEQGRQLATKYAKTEAGMLASGLASAPARLEEAIDGIQGRRRGNWRFWIDTTSSLLLGVGNMLPAGADFL